MMHRLIAGIVLFSFFTAFTGSFFFFRPEVAIDAQKKFYEKLNWRMCPINPQKELRNTKIMGVVLTLVSAATLAAMAAG